MISLSQLFNCPVGTRLSHDSRAPSSAGTSFWTLRPVFAERLSAEAKAKFLPDSEYAPAKPVHLKKLAAAQAKIVERYKNEVQ